MNWIDRPIEPTKALKRGIRKIDQVERRRQALLEHDRERKLAQRISADQRRARTMKLRRIHGGYSDGWSVAETRVLTAWHTDETGCRARVVGCDA